MPSNNNKKEKNSNSNSPKPKTLKTVPIRKLLNEILNEQEKSKPKTRNPNPNWNSNNENLTIKQLQEKYSKLQKKLTKLAPNNDGQIWIMEELLKLSLQISAKQKIKDRKKTMTSKINNLKGKKVVRRLNLTKK